MATAPRSKNNDPSSGRSKTKTPRYEPVLELPPLPFEQYSALRDNVALRRVMQPILVDCDGPIRRIIDGNIRKQIADELGYDCPEIVASGLTDQEQRTQARALNLARRQLDQAAKRAIIADQLRETPGLSNRLIGKMLGVSHPTVASVRQEMEATGKLYQLDRTQGADGKSRPSSFANGKYQQDFPSQAGIETYGKNERRQELLPSSASKNVEPEITLDDFEEEDILRAAAEIRQRRVASQIHNAQERRRVSQPTPLPRKRGTPVLHGDCNDLIPTLKDASVALVVTSPPYANQREGHYEGISEKVYPEYTVGWMEAIGPKLTSDGSVFLVIRPHLRDGVVSDYVLRTRLALRDGGWNECEELIWYKPNSPPLGSKLRPRRAWESILWFSKTAQPFCDLKACGKPTDRLGFDGSIKFAEDGVSEKTAWHPCVESFGYGSGTARVTDVFVASVGSDDAGVEHPAMYPISLAEQLIKTFSVVNDLVLDPFCGSGQTLLAAKGCRRRFMGIEREEKYVKIVLERLGK